MSLLSQEEIALLTSDSKYKSYVTAIEKSLKNFESSTEWADLISSLGKLKKVLQSFPKYAFVPKRVSVCKRLAQCLHPALPSGVHLKALEVYTVIFQNIGSEMLSKDLFLYSSGLFPLLANAALSVKPVLLSMYETYFLPLRTQLKPCLIGLLIGILPGLEDGSDFYQRSFNLLKNICIAQSDAPVLLSTMIADDKYFYTCLWSAIVSQSSIRFPAIQFILTNYENRKKLVNLQQQQANSMSNQMPSKRELEDQLYLIGNSIDLMINGICCCLQDSNPLVQRSVLDLIGFCLPINTQQITRNDKIQLIIVVIHVVLRRDMSLNRRIYSWLTGSSSNTAPAGNMNQPQANSSVQGPDSSSQDLNSGSNTTGAAEKLGPPPAAAQPSNYFNTYSKELLITAIKMILNNKKDSGSAHQILYLMSEEQLTLTGIGSGTSTLSNASNLQPGSGGSAALANSASTNTILKIIKIVSNLVERQEIGQNIIDEILLDLLFFIYKECQALTGALSSLSSVSLSNGAAFQQAFNRANAQTEAVIQQNLKEIRKATCNFLFQSFQLYFIWEFCANKFEKICQHFTSSGMTNNSNNNYYSGLSNGGGLYSSSSANFDSVSANTDMVVSPAQLCDLYKFILELLTNSVSETFHK
jgi:galactitol-specific phosphotransferase system IIB component